MPEGAILPKIFFLAFVCAAQGLCADYPQIKSLSRGDVVFRQLQEDIQRYHTSRSRGEAPPPLCLYSYTLTDADKKSGVTDFLDLAARLTLSQESIATLNRLDKNLSPIEGKRLLLPGVPGIFVWEMPRGVLESLASWRDREKAVKITIGDETAFFFPGERFHPVELAFFQNRLFAFPLDTQVITSRYGTRVSPISGRTHFHAGLDLAAPKGSRVYAARAGTVTRKEHNGVLGNHIVIAHSGGLETIYGHLDSTDVTLNQNVESGTIIGRVGSTGASTGPHLHFEVREKGSSRNPESFLPRRIKP
ncbi:MAG: M23 family metallopeptidase [Spirochaetia bacterium]|nr:M23 family metallopeptidase [Spirochaetia bacterium]